MGTSDDMLQMQVSIIVPVFNEAPFIRPFLEHLRERAAEAEIIVVDGASTDGTDELAAGFCDQLIRSGQPSRAIQMNAGVCAAKATFSGSFMQMPKCQRDVWMRLTA